MAVESTNSKMKLQWDMARQRAYDPMPEDDDDLDDQYSPQVDPSSTGATGDAKRISHKHWKNQWSVNYQMDFRLNPHDEVPDAHVNLYE